MEGILRIETSGGTVEVDLARLSDEQIRGAIVKGLHEFFTDSYAGKPESERRAALDAKLKRLYEGTVPGVGHTGGGKRLSDEERECRAVAEAMFRKRGMKAEVARKAAQNWERELAELIRASGNPDWENVAEKSIEAVRAAAKRRLALAADLPEVQA